MFWKKKEEEIEEPIVVKEKLPLPKHVALDLEGIGKWAEKNGISLDEAYRKCFMRTYHLIEKQIELNIPIATFFIMSPSLRTTPQAEPLIATFAEFLEKDTVRLLFNRNKIKVTVLGKWYDLPQNVVSAIRKIGEETKDYDSFFVNFCLNSDGQDEILDAFKLLGRQIKAGKMDPDLLKKEMIKDNLYSSYFIPPDLVIRNGVHKRLTSLLLWDTPGARIVFSEKLFPDLTVEEFEELLT